MFQRLFLDHPSSVDESYVQHARFAFGFAFWLLVAGLAALVHAVLPFAFERTGSDIIRRLYARIEHRGR
tara:strand:+ start:25733 stop:25939 length:207 start_codon:yes stop_codon:yes gene_type:complete